MSTKPSAVQFYVACWTLLAAIVLDIVLGMVLLGYAEWRYRHEQGENGLDRMPAILFWADDDKMTDRSLRRINFALDQWRQGRISAFICVGGARQSKNAHGAAVMGKTLASRGVPTKNLLIGTGSNDTRSNLDEARSLAEAAGFETIFLITDSLHMLRIELVLSRRLGGIKYVPKPYSYQWATPTAGLVELWERVNYEFVAYLAFLLPDKLYLETVNWMRK